MKNTLPKCAVLLGLLFAVLPAAWAQITFTLNVTSVISKIGYTIGSDYNFIFTVVPDTSGIYVENTLGESASVAWWYSFGYEQAQTPIWHSIAGDGLGGTYNSNLLQESVDSSFTLLFNFYTTNPLFELDVAVPTYPGDEMGLTANGVPVLGVHMHTFFPTLSLTDPGAERVSISTYFASKDGVYNADQIHSNFGEVITIEGQASFMINSLTIDGAGGVVPEPSTYAAICGALALGFVAYKRRRSEALVD